MTTKIYIPNIGEDELEVTDIMVKIKDKIYKNQPLIILEGDKTSIEIPASHSGTIKSIEIEIGDKVKTGSLIIILNETQNQKQTTIKNNISQNNTLTSHTYNNEFMKNYSNYNIHASPLIRRMARTFEIDLKKIQGTGRKKRILLEDIQKHIQKNIKHNTQNIELKHKNIKTSQIPFNITSWPQTNFEKFGKIKIVELKKIQKISGANLHRNWIMLPHVTQFDEIDITDLEKFRKQKNKELRQENTNLKITPIIFIMKAVAKALEKLPQFNSSLSENGQMLILKKYINIGIAVNTNNSLLVPVIRDVNKKNIITLTEALATILKKISSHGQLVASDMQGGCFTISSLGKIGGTAFTPIVNAPEVAILGISKSLIKPIWNGKKFIPRLMLPLTLSYDHRVINGVDGAQFMQIINKILSDIRNLII